MTKKKISIDEFVKNQVKKWEKQFTGKKASSEAQIPVITVAMEPGSGGSIIAEKIADQLGFDYFHRDIVQQISKTAKIRSTVVNSLEKERLSGVKDFISSLMEDQYIHPDTYLKHLLVVISTIGKHGRAVIVGRGANFILPAEDIFAVRVICPLEKRIREVALTHRVTAEEAKRRVIRRESRRKAFVRHSFNADISDPIHYDLTINTGKMSIESAVEAVIGAVMARLGDSA
ncbi:MAG: cytidylate kinase-like family protein [Desulfobacteraceae bacterium]|jgi:cytidylate kinase|nr:cytidylate kinase-like family protein [Desulfobacteraceae bacterium]